MSTTLKTAESDAPSIRTSNCGNLSLLTTGTSTTRVKNCTAAPRPPRLSPLPSLPSRPWPPPQLCGLVPPHVRVIHVVEQPPPRDTSDRLHPPVKELRLDVKKPPGSHGPSASMSWSPQRLRHKGFDGRSAWKLHLPGKLRTGVQTPHFLHSGNSARTPFKSPLPNTRT